MQREFRAARVEILIAFLV